MSERNVSRRTVLKAMSVGAGAAVVGLPRHAAAGVDENSYEILENGAGKFRVEIDGAPVASANVEAIHIDDLTIDVLDLGEDRDGYRLFGPGDAHYGSITVASRVGADRNELYDWWLDCSRGQDARRDISVVCLKRDGTEARRFNCLECYPTRWDAGDYSPSSRVAVETIVCKMGRVEFCKSSGPSPSPLPGNRGNNENWMFGVAGPQGDLFLETDWQEISGGALGNADAKQDAAPCAAPGSLALSPLVCAGPMTVRPWPHQMLGDTLRGSGRPVNPRYTVQLIDTDDRGRVLRVATYLSCFPTRYAFPSLSASGTGNLYEEVGIKPIRLELT